MKFQNKKEELRQTIGLVALIISLGAISLQIWVLFSALEAFFQRRFEILLPSVFLSGLAFLACGASALLTKVNFIKGLSEGRTKTYQTKNYRRE